MFFAPGIAGAVIGGVSAGIGYRAGNPNGSWSSTFGVAGAGAAIGFVAAYAPGFWGGIIAGGAGGMFGDYFGQRISAKEKRECFEWDWKEGVTQGGLGAVGGAMGFGAAGPAKTFLGPIFGGQGWAEAVGVSFGSYFPMFSNMLVPTSLGGYRPSPLDPSKGTKPNIPNGQVSANCGCK